MASVHMDEEIEMFSQFLVETTARERIRRRRQQADRYRLVRGNPRRLRGRRRGRTPPQIT